MIIINAYIDETSAQREKFIDPAAISPGFMSWRAGGRAKATASAESLAVSAGRIDDRPPAVGTSSVAGGTTIPGPAGETAAPGARQESETAPLGYPARAAPRRPSRAPSTRHLRVPPEVSGAGGPEAPHRVEARKARSPDRERDRNRQSGSDRAVVSPIRRARRGSSSLRGPRRLSYHARGSRSGDSRIRPAARRGSLTSAWPCGRTGGAGIPGGRCRCCRLVSGGRCGRTGGVGIPGWRGDAATRRRRRMAAERGSHDPDRRRPFHRASAAGRPS